MKNFNEIWMMMMMMVIEKLKMIMLSTAALPDLLQWDCGRTLSFGRGHVCGSGPEHYQSTNRNHFYHSRNHNADPDHCGNQVSQGSV